MAVLEYPYSPRWNSPEADCVAVNILNGRLSPFVGVLDTGASITALTKYVFWDLDIDLDSLPEDIFDGSGGEFPTKLCDFIKIAFVETSSLRKHWPNDSDPVPVGLSFGNRNLLGRDLFLDRCVVTFNGPKKMAFVDLGVKDIQLAGHHRRR